MASPSALRLPALAFALLIATPPLDVAAQARFFAVRGGMSWTEAVKSAVVDLDRVKPPSRSTTQAGRLSFSYNARFNPAYWISTNPALGRYGLKPGVNPAEAVMDILKNPDEYSIECATALKFILYIAMIRVIGSGPFNEAAKRTPLEIGAKKYESILAAVMARGYGRSPEDANFPGMASWDCAPSPECDHKAVKRNDDPFIKDGSIQIGDGLYMVNLKTRDKGYQGENIVYYGDGKVFGYPFGLDDVSVIRRKLSEYWINDPGKSQIAGIPNGPPGFVKDYYRMDAQALAKLGNWVEK